MIRQEDLHLELAKPGQAVVSDRQFLGREYRYSLLLPSGARLYARTSTRSLIPIGSNVQLSVSDQAVRYFPDLLESANLERDISLDRLSPVRPLT
jgi:iron(III) transport system ATP-binding protein